MKLRSLLLASCLFAGSAFCYAQSEDAPRRTGGASTGGGDETQDPPAFEYQCTTRHTDPHDNLKSVTSKLIFNNSNMGKPQGDDYFKLNLKASWWDIDESGASIGKFLTSFTLTTSGARSDIDAPFEVKRVKVSTSLRVPELDRAFVSAICIKTK